MFCILFAGCLLAQEKRPVSEDAPLGERTSEDSLSSLDQIVPTVRGQSDLVSDPLSGVSGGIAGQSTVSTQPVSEPPAGRSITDPTFGMLITRLTDLATNGGFGTHAYSQLQAFSSDNQYIFLIENEEYLVRRVDNGVLAYAFLPDSVNNPRWQPAKEHTMVHFDSNADETLLVQYTNIDTGVVETVFTFSLPYTRIRPTQSFDELSRDGRWLAGLASNQDGSATIFSLDLEDRRLGAQIPLPFLYSGACAPDPEYGELEPDWVGVSPLGNYLVVQWERDGTERCSGLETFDIKTGEFVGRVNDRHPHGDLGITSDGREFFMTFELVNGDDNNRPSQGIRYLPGSREGVADPVYLQAMDWGTQSHISCRGPADACLVTANNGGDVPFSGEIFIQYINGSVLRLAHHRSTECGYWVQPRASWSQDGKYIVFASDWGNQDSCIESDLGRGDAYLIEVGD